MIQSVMDLINPHRKISCTLLKRHLPDNTPIDEIEALVDQEIFNFDYRFYVNPALLECSPESVVLAFRKTIYQGLSFDMDYGLVWLMPRNSTINQKQVKLLECNKSVNGWISIYKLSGSLIDVQSKINKDENGYVTSVDVTLITPKYSGNGDITGEERTIYHITLDDFRTLQRASHKQNAGSSGGNIQTLNKSNELYWSYTPELRKSADSPTPEKPGGIHPGFANTKAIGLALKRAQLTKSMYSKPQYIEHKRYVDEGLDDDITPTFPVREYPDEPEAPPPAQQTFTPTQQELKDIIDSNPALEISKTISISEGEYSDDEKISILNQFNSLICKEDCIALYNSMKQRITMPINTSLDNGVKSIGATKLPKADLNKIKTYDADNI